MYFVGQKKIPIKVLYIQALIKIASLKCGIYEKCLIKAVLNPCPYPCPAETCYPAFSNSVDLKKPTDLDLHCLPFSK